MLIQRTAKADQELRSGTRTLGLKERSVLFLANGRRSANELDALLDAESRALMKKLLEEGYLLALRSQPNPRPAAPEAVAAGAAAASEPTSAPAERAASADAFEGKRSLATTRMFLFDLCERMFARRDPAAAARFRDALRNARDRASMLEVSRSMIEEIERLAGPERADSISERIAMLLPPETLAID